MPDREKVIKGLETCIPMKYETNEEKECRHEQCPYGRENYKPMNGCFWDLMSDALTLLKEREAVVPKVSCTEQRCGNCNKIIEMDGWKACPWCGKMIDWKGWWKKNGTHDNT